MKKTLILSLTLFFALFLSFPIQQAGAQEEKPVNILMFYGRGCPHCGRTIEYLNFLQGKYPGLIVHQYETYFNQENRELFERVTKAFGIEIEGVPTSFVDEQYFVGFSQNIAENMESTVIECKEKGCIDPLERLHAYEAGDQTISDAEEREEEIIIALDGEKTEEETEDVQKEDVDEEVIIADEVLVPSDAEQQQEKTIVHTLTLPVVISAAIVDAINPCAFAVLIILITTVLATRRRKHAFCSGLAFSLAIFISYYMMGIGLYSAIQISGLTHIIYEIIAVLAIIIGLFNLKDYLWYGKWFVMEVPLSWRPKLRCLISGVTSVPGAFLIGFVVSVFLLPCTSGPYIVILGLLTKATTRNYALILLAFYNLIFVFPMILITTIVSLGMTTAENLEQWRTRRVRALHLIAGLIILGLGVGMLTALWLGYV